MIVGGFDWDDGNRDKCQKHGVAIAEIESLFDGELTVFPDVEHSRREERIIAIGRTRKGRYMRAREVAYCEKAIAEADER